VEALVAKARKSQIVENWIGLVRTPPRCASRGKALTTKAAQIRALWPEVEAALHMEGHSTKKILCVAGGRGWNHGWRDQFDFLPQPPSPPGKRRSPRVEVPPLDFARAGNEARSRFWH